MKRAILLCLSLMLTALAYAGTAELSWTPPTKNTDGSTIPATGPDSLASYKVYYGTANNALNQSLSAPGSPFNVTDLANGTWYFAVSAVNASGVEGPRTSVVSRTFAPPTPAAPTGLTVRALTAYTLVKGKDRFVLLPVGTVPADTPCNPNQTVNGYYVVPTSAVTWSGTVRPDVVVANCT